MRLRENYGFVVRRASAWAPAAARDIVELLIRKKKERPVKSKTRKMSVGAGKSQRDFGQGRWSSGNQEPKYEYVKLGK